uniref:DUF4773 domain-containing protein n=1 Tax=Clastoptera arizonana TaxID=38151 RepID=A0A1B6D3G1_9HEMI
MRQLVITLFLCTTLWKMVSPFDVNLTKFQPIYYDDNNEPIPMLANITQISPTLKSQVLRYGFLPCSCEDFTCGCCANMNIRLFNFRRHACMNLTYDPYEFSVGMNMLMDEESIYETSFSAKNPPPACLQVPMPYVPTIDFCVRVFDIFTPGRNLHMCMNFESRIERVPVMVLQFDCLQMGADGINLLKPEDIGEESTEAPEKEDLDLASDVFDEVNEVKRNTSLLGNKTKTVLIDEKSTKLPTFPRAK